MEVMMFRELTFAAVIVLGGVALSVPVVATDRGGEFDRATDDFNQMPPRAAGESQNIGFDQVAQHRDGLDRDRYWHDGECFPTAPGGCD
jgi:hypothetical protein